MESGRGKQRGGGGKFPSKPQGERNYEGNPSGDDPLYGESGQGLDFEPEVLNQGKGKPRLSRKEKKALKGKQRNKQVAGNKKKERRAKKVKQIKERDQDRQTGK